MITGLVIGGGGGALIGGGVLVANTLGAPEVEVGEGVAAVLFGAFDLVKAVIGGAFTGGFLGGSFGMAGALALTTPGCGK